MVIKEKDSKMKNTAQFSKCRNYRYSLHRMWDESLPKVMFIALNPSTADEVTNDRTVNRCINFAKSWDYGGLIMANIFAYRSTDPKKLKQAPNDDPIGPNNDKWISKLQDQADLVVIAWGTRGVLHKRNESILKVLKNPFYLKLTKYGHPGHPLYIPKDTKPKRFKK